MDSGGHVYVSQPTGRLAGLTDLSEPIRAISRNYEQLAKRIRVFVSPRITALVTKQRRIDYRKELQAR